MRRDKLQRWVVGSVAIAVSVVVFLVPFAFVVLQAMKTPVDANQLRFTWPQQWVPWQNLVTVFETNDGILIRGFVNSSILTIASVVVMVIVGAMVGYVLERRQSRLNAVVNFFLLAGLIVPPAVVPTVWLLQSLGIFKTMPSMILIEVTYGIAFCVLLFRAFVATIPKELDEAAILDGAGPIRLFFSVIMPLLRPVMVTVVVVQAVAVFNDFANPLYFFPGNENATVQVTLYAYQSQAANQYNLLFMNLLLITIPPLVLYIFFNRQIVAGMTSGAIKG